MKTWNKNLCMFLNHLDAGWIIMGNIVLFVIYDACDIPRGNNNHPGEMNLSAEVFYFIYTLHITNGHDLSKKILNIVFAC